MNRTKFRALKFFDHETGKPVEVFADPECKTPQPQPVLLSESGNPPPVFMADKDRAYDVAALDFRGQEVWRSVRVHWDPTTKLFFSDTK